MAAGAGAGAAAAAAAVMNAVAAAGGLIRLAPEEFQSLLYRAEDPLVVYSNQWVLFTYGAHNYLMPYRGVNFVTRSVEELILPKGAEVIVAKSLYLPV
ncbi:hypothetical protein [Anatilimnocola floriformis]|uniref:hypothetical protein n=1 Tax=Anatilimnocola floriformis TaxID=2948575 RepID=UPI0020C51013|nr:hypothetical protein [Anatilimnocola floriformis]